MSIIRDILNSTKLLVNNSLPTTGSNTFRGTQTFSGSLIPATDNTYDLGSPEKQFRDLYLSSASLYIDGTKVLGSTAQELTITTDEGQSIKILEAGSDSIVIQTSDGDIELKSSGDGDVLLDPTNGLISIKGTLQIQDGNKITSSGGNNVIFGNNIVVSGSIESVGNINGIDLASFSSSIASTFLNQNSVNLSYETKGSGIVSGSSQIIDVLSSLNTYTSSNDTTNTTQNNRLTSLETKSGSVDSSISSINSFTSSNGNTALNDYTSSLKTAISVDGQNVTVNGNFTVSGTQTVVDSTTVQIGDNILELNGSGAANGGIQVKDATSPNLETGSLIWDSTNDYWKAGVKDSEVKILLANGDSVVSGSSQVSYTGLSSIPSGIVSGSSQITLSSTSGYGSVINQAVLTSSSPTFAGLTSTSNVGIGTASPGYRLVVNSATDGISAGIAGSTYGIRFDNGGTFSSGMSTIHGVDSTLVGSYQPIMLNGLDVRFGTSATEQMRITSSGNVGIGNASPDLKLSISGTAGNVTTDIANGNLLELYGGTISSANYGVGIRFTREGSQMAFISAARENTSDEAGFLSFATQTGAGTHPERMRITSGGYLKLPQSRILGDSDICFIDLYNPNTGNLSLTNTSSNSTYGNIILSTNNTEQMRITQGGNVSIGTPTDTGYKLYVLGAAGVSSSVTANNYIASQEGINVSNFGFLSQTLSGQMTILGHNVRASNSVNNQVNVVNGGWISSMIKMYYNDGITFHTSPTNYSAGAVYPMDTTTERVKIQTDGQVRFQSSIILTNGQINSLTSGGSGQSMYLNFGGNGTIYAGSSYAVLYAGSDERIKTEINHSQSTLTKILNLTPRTFKYKERPEITNYGFIAQEVEAVMPELVRTSEGITMCLDEAIENQKSVESYGLAWAAILVKAIQEQQEVIELLKSRIENLEQV